MSEQPTLEQIDACLDNGGHHWNAAAIGERFVCTGCQFRGATNLPAVNECNRSPRRAAATADDIDGVVRRVADDVAEAIKVDSFADALSAILRPLYADIVAVVNAADSTGEGESAGIRLAWHC